MRLAALVLLVALLAGCSGDPQDAYCEVVEEHQAALSEIAASQDAGALFTLRAPTLDQLTEVADRGEVMPPKTTYFDPKPYAGIFLR